MKQILSMNKAIILSDRDAFELNHPSTIFTDDDVEVILGVDDAELEKKLVSATTANTALPPLPKVGEMVYKDKLYLSEGKIYKCVQEHTRMLYSPAETLALFNVYRKEESEMTWIAGEKVALGVKRIYDGKTYEVVQPHVTQSDWTPDRTPALWKLIEEPTPEIPVWKQPTGAHDAYKKGDKVHFPKITDPIYESLIDANVWSPLIYAAGWRKL